MTPHNILNHYHKQEIIDTFHTLADYIRLGTSLFQQADLYFGHGNASALDEAAAIVLQTLALPPDLHTLYFSSRLTDNEKQHILNHFWRRIEEHIPAAYLTHTAWFAGLPFYVDERVLVPRSPIAELIMQQFEPWVEPEQVEHILDLCTGSGCIAIACAHYFPMARVDAVDISSDALAVAHKNIKKHHLQEQIRAIESDLFTHISGSYQIIVSNPPYVDAEDMSLLPQEYQAEPALGLAAGDDGLDLVIPILEQAAHYLTDNGILIVEVGNSAYALENRYPDLPFYWLEFEQGGGGVFLLTKEQLEQYF